MDRESMELAVYLLGDEFGILGKYPIAETSIYGIFMIFSLNVFAIQMPFGAIIKKYYHVLKILGLDRFNNFNHRHYRMHLLGHCL